MLWGKVNLFTAAMSWEILGEERGKKGFRKDFTNVQGKQTKQRTRNGARNSFKACRLIFKMNFISILSTEGHLLKKKTVKLLDHMIKPIIAI